jgi:hypothetical protein
MNFANGAIIRFYVSFPWYLVMLEDREVLSPSFLLVIPDEAELQRTLHSEEIRFRLGAIRRR